MSVMYSVGLRVVHDKLGIGTVVFVKRRNNSSDLVSVKFDVEVENTKDDIYADRRKTQKFLASTDKLRELK